MTAIGLVIKPGVQQALSLAEALLQWAQERSVTVHVDPISEKLLRGEAQEGALPHQARTVWMEELPKRSDVVVSLGGDGTLIGVARHAAGTSAIMVGVNFGTLGFLTEVRPTELFDVLGSIFGGTAVVGYRSLLSCQLLRGQETRLAANALNDVVIHKGTTDRLLEIDVTVDAHPLACVRADGLIIATPTGSTAYSLAAGGSIAHPEVPVTLITPICPHSLTLRPLVIPSEAVVTLQFPEYEGDISVIIDGQVSQPIKPGDTVVVSKAPSAVSFVRVPERSYFDVLTAKLNWGIPNRAY